MQKVEPLIKKRQIKWLSKILVNFSLTGNEPGVKFSVENLFIKVVGREYIYTLRFIGSS